MIKLNNIYDVIVIGGGHAGTEAALASARMGAQTLLMTHSSDTLGELSCNPSIGGIGKSHLVKEIDALGGVMAKAADFAGIQYRILNASKGPAVRATRVQVDRELYKQMIRETLENQENLFIFQDSVIDLIIENNCVIGVITQSGLRLQAKAVILTAGTFLNGKIYIGRISYPAGRMGHPAAITLAENLRKWPFKIARLKTGTPARLDSKTIDYSKLTVQHGDPRAPNFSFFNTAYEHEVISQEIEANGFGSCQAKHPHRARKLRAMEDPRFACHPKPSDTEYFLSPVFEQSPQARQKQMPCYITQTNAKTHEIIREYLSESPLYRGDIEGIGPRYCPSIEDKVVRFSDKTSHQIFLEPEGLHTQEIYPNGISTSLPFDAQVKFIHSIEGLENAHITRAGYAIEYDYFDPRDLYPSLETKLIKNLFFAGQINGTTGYEEAAAQGLLAGINAVLTLKNQPLWYPRRDQAYIGVMIDDLITQGTKEPYRMFTSRAEYRLLLREDNADLRLTEIGKNLGLINNTQWEIFLAKKNAIDLAKKQLKTLHISPNTPEAKMIENLTHQILSKNYSLENLLKRPEINSKILDKLMQITIPEQVEIEIKYEGYIKRQEADIAKQLQHELLEIPIYFNYELVQGLSNEVRQKLTQIKPSTIGMASRIPGITPAAISILLIYLKRFGHGAG